jgi:hypothetical protein
LLPASAVLLAKGFGFGSPSVVKRTKPEGAISRSQRTDAFIVIIVIIVTTVIDNLEIWCLRSASGLQ